MQISLNYCVNEFLFRFGNVTTRTEHLYFSRFSETEWGWRDDKCWWAQTLETQHAEVKKCFYKPWALSFPKSICALYIYTPSSKTVHQFDSVGNSLLAETECVKYWLAELKYMSVCDLRIHMPCIVSSKFQVPKVLSTDLNLWIKS